MVESVKSDVAFYYPGHIWTAPEWIKTLMLFFDGVGLLVPEYKQGEPELFSPELAGPLRDKGLLHYLVADKTVDKAAANKLAEAMTRLLDEGAFDKLDIDTAFHSISQSRLGFDGDEIVANALLARLRDRGLARISEDGVSIPLHPLVRYLVLTLLAQILRAKGPDLGLDLSPATDRADVVEGLSTFLNLPGVPSAGNVVAFDVNTVAVDLTTIPLDEVLGFKTEHGKEYRAYTRSVRRFARELSLMPEDERSRAFAERQAELDDVSSDLKRTSRRAWGRPASFALGLTAAFWTWQFDDDLIGGLLAAGSLVTSEFANGAHDVGAFSFLFAARNRALY